MNDVVSDIEHLAREIGPRPAGTEEERVSAMYIAENIQKRSGLSFNIEDFEGINGKSKAIFLCSIISCVVLLLAMFLPIVTIPAIVLTLIMAVVIVMESLDKPFFSNFLKSGISQNVVVKYKPSFSPDKQAAQRKRKIVLISHYDSGHACPGDAGSYFNLKSTFRIVSIFSCCFAPILLIIKSIICYSNSGSSYFIFLSLSLLFILLSLIPLIMSVIESKRPYNEAANCNASGCAALIKIAKMLGTGSYDQNSADVQYDPVVHGYNSSKNLAPENTKLNYEVEPNLTDENIDPLLIKEQGLASAKAAIEAFTHPKSLKHDKDDDSADDLILNKKKSENTDFNELTQKIDQINKTEDNKSDVDGEAKKKNITNITIDDASAKRASVTLKKEVSIKTPSTSTKVVSNTIVPDWYKKAQNRAKKQDKDDIESIKSSGQRSRFAHTLDLIEQRKIEEKKRQEAEQEAKKEKLRAEIKAAQEAAEADRREKFKEDSPFFRKDEQTVKEIAEQPVKEVKAEAEIEKTTKFEPIQADSTAAISEKSSKPVSSAENGNVVNTDSVSAPVDNVNVANMENNEPIVKVEDEISSDNFSTNNDAKTVNTNVNNQANVMSNPINNGDDINKQMHESHSESQKDSSVEVVDNETINNADESGTSLENQTVQTDLSSDMPDNEINVVASTKIELDKDSGKTTVTRTVERQINNKEQLTFEPQNDGNSVDTGEKGAVKNDDEITLNAGQVQDNLTTSDSGVPQKNFTESTDENKKFDIFNPGMNIAERFKRSQQNNIKDSNKVEKSNTDNSAKSGGELFSNDTQVPEIAKPVVAKPLVESSDKKPEMKDTNNSIKNAPNNIINDARREVDQFDIQAPVANIPEIDNESTSFMPPVDFNNESQSSSNFVEKVPVQAMSQEQVQTSVAPQTAGQVKNIGQAPVQTQSSLQDQADVQVPAQPVVSPQPQAKDPVQVQPQTPQSQFQAPVNPQAQPQAFAQARPQSQSPAQQQQEPVGQAQPQPQVPIQAQPQPQVSIQAQPQPQVPIQAQPQPVAQPQPQVQDNVQVQPQQAVPVQPQSSSQSQRIDAPINLDESKQYAPLASEDFVSGSDLPQNPSIFDLPEVIDNVNPENDEAYIKALKDSDKQIKEEEIERGKFGTGSFAAISQTEGMAGSTGAFAPVSENLVEEASLSGHFESADLVVQDADDSAFTEGQYTDQGAFSGEGYVDIPETRKKGFFRGLFGRKKDKGKHSQNEDFKGNSSNDNWEGGGFSAIGQKMSEAANKIKNFDPKNNKQESHNEEDYGQDYNNQEYVNNDYNDPQDFYPDNSQRPITDENSRIETIVDAVPDFDQQIQDFHRGSINLEVWMVALGSELGENSGIKSFILEHSHELRGALFIDIEGLADGKLSLVDTEGIIKKTKTPSRIKRYIRTAANKMGISISTIDIPWSTSSAHYINKAGMKAIRLVGAEGNKPAHYMEKDDNLSHINPEILSNNIDYLMQLMQTI